MGYRLPSYSPDACCKGGHCPFGKPGEPCWGRSLAADEVDFGDGGHGWVHACEGHAGVVAANYGGPYVPSGLPEDQGAAAVEDNE